MQSFNNSIFKSSLLTTVFVGLWLPITCSKPFEPVEAKDYPFYISGSNPSQLYVFYPISKKLDSVSVPWNSLVTVSADGEKLYLGHGTSVAVYDADSFTFITDLPYSLINPVAVSPNNEFIAISGYDLYILRASDYSIVFIDSTQLLYEDGSFSADGKTYFCPSLIHQDSSFVVYQVDLSGSLFPVTRKGFADGSVNQVAPSIDDSKWFLYLDVALWTSAFEVYDVLRDSIIFRDILVPGAGRLAISPDGKYVFYTNAPQSATDPPSEPQFKIFDVESNQISAIVSDTNYYCVSTTYGKECVKPKFLAITPDSRWLGILGGDGFIRPTFYLYDIQKGALVHREVEPTLDYRFINISVQNMK